MEKRKFGNIDTDAVSPVVGVMLMLVVTIIIAAVVSAFSGGLMGDQSKTPQATIKATFSITEGLKILHTGGDPLPMHELVFTIWDGPTFGPDVETVSKQVLDMSLIRDDDGIYVLGEGGTYNKTSFRPGEMLTISADDSSPDLLQPNIMPTDYTPDMGTDYDGDQANRWALCLKNPDNIGNEFILAVSRSDGTMISKTEVTVTA